MREKELRIALVCFGGVSLAVYMHGISKEILKLIRASGALHALTDRAQRAKASFFDRYPQDDPEYDTEAVYFDLLREIGSKVELRVVVDIIAGASAGGINGTMLARAICHDLPMDKMRNLWIENADVTVLLAKEAKATAWSKWFIKPLIWLAARTGRLKLIEDPEVREKFSLFVRSRWFKPPLSGPIMAGLMYDAVMSMGAPRSPEASLLPSGLSFDLFVTLTDYHGYHELIQIHDPPLIHEQEHHHVLHFSYRRRPNGEVDSDFVLENAPGLAFAARATSSFPGAFPPALITEMDELVVRRKGSWHKRAEFIARNFDGHVRAGLDPTTASFIDGAILNNRPFQQAISAIHGRPAYRQVDRRLVYIDPHPGTPTTPLERAVPGFFSTLRGALSDIPSSQPVTDELGWVIEFNEQVRRLRAIIASARPHISELVAEVVTHTFDRPISGKELRFWREQVNSHVARDAGFAYEAYVRFKLASVRRFVTQTIVRLRGMPAQSPLARVVSEIIDTWAVRRHIAYDRSGRDALDFEVASVEKLPDWVNFLLAFDVKYRERRLHFLIEGQNRLYQMIEKDGLKDFNPLVIDRLKRDFYGRLDALRVRETPGFFSADAHKMVADIFPTVPTAGEIRNLERFANDFVELHRDKLDQLIARLSDEINLNASTRDIDELLAALKFDEWHPDARREVLVNYLGFPFWDVLTFPVTSTRQMGEFNEILVDRISPQDARSLKGFDGPECLKGIGLGHFAGFLSRGYRENDYLLGRLHALDRLIDIVCDSAGLDAEDNIDVVALKKKGFTRILQAEAKHLPKSKDLIATLYRCIDDIAAP